MSLVINVPPIFNRYAACPCGSGRKAKFCCNIITGQWHKEPATLSPPPPLTNKAVAGCYLSITNDCAGPLSREHYVSAGILRQIGSNGKSAVHGLPWMKDKEFTRVSSQSLVAKVLCKRHNEALSPLDAEASRLKETIGRFDADFGSSSPKQDLAIAAGEDVERWMLKTLCGFVASKQHQKYEFQPLDRWAAVLSGNESWPAAWGLYLPLQDFQHARHYRFETLTKPNGEIALVNLPINNVKFAFAMPQTPGGCKGGIFRPRYLHFQQRNVRKTLILSWQNQIHQKWVEFTRTGETSAEAPDWPNYDVKDIR